MRNKKAKHRILCLIILIPVVLSISHILAGAQTYPDISGLGRMYVLSGNRQFFSRSGGGYVLVSSSSSETMVTPLLEDGTPDCFEGTRLPFVYGAGAVCGDFLYLAGSAYSPVHSLMIYRVGFAQGSYISNITPPVSPDFTRGMRADADGTVFLVTVPYGSALSSSSPFVAYRFVPQDGAACTGVPVSEPASSAAASSAAPASSQPSASSAVPVSSAAPSLPSSQAQSSASSSPAPQPESYRFSSPVTVEQLRQTLLTENNGETVRVTAPDGTPVPGGAVGTGFLVELLRNGQTERLYSAVIPGDLTGDGTPGEESRSLLYAHVANRAPLAGPALKAADVNNDGAVDTADLLQLKKQMK